MCAGEGGCIRKLCQSMIIILFPFLMSISNQSIPSQSKLHWKRGFGKHSRLSRSISGMLFWERCIQQNSSEICTFPPVYTRHAWILNYISDFSQVCCIGLKLYCNVVNWLKWKTWEQCLATINNCGQLFCPFGTLQHNQWRSQDFSEGEAIVTTQLVWNRFEIPFLTVYLRGGAMAHPLNTLLSTMYINKL